MKPQQAITIFDEHLVYLAKRRMINSYMLTKLVDALKTLAESRSDADAIKEANENSVINKYLDILLLVETCGFTKKGIKKYMDLPEDFREYWKETCKVTGHYPNKKNRFELMLMTERQCRLLAEGDINTLRQYKMLKELELEQTTKQFRQLYPRLQKWFDTIDIPRTYNELKAYHEFYAYHIQ